MFRREFTMGCRGWLAESVGRWLAESVGRWRPEGQRERPEACGEFLQFTVGSYPRQNALQQGVAPTMDQICCTVGSKPTQNHLCGRLLPTVNCRNCRYRHSRLTGLCSPWRAVHSHCRSPRGPFHEQPDVLTHIFFYSLFRLCKQACNAA